MSETKMKESTVPRTYDPDGLRRRAACLCFKDRSEQEVLLITSTNHPSKWTVPGGGVDPGEEPAPAAEREAWEEAGVIGTIDRLLGVFENNEKKTRTWVYALYVESLQDDWIEAKSFGFDSLVNMKDMERMQNSFDIADRRRQWFPLTDAKQHLSKHNSVQVNYINVIENGKVMA